MTTNSNSATRFLSDLWDMISWVIGSIWALLPWWVWLIILWFALSVVVALHLGPRLKRNRQAQFGEDDDDNI